MVERATRQWDRPTLVVLMRGKPEENVLVGCKNKAATGPAGLGCKALDGSGNCAAHGNT